MICKAVESQLGPWSEAFYQDEGFELKHKLVPWLWRRSWDWKGFQSDWLSLCLVQGREVVQLAGDLKGFK